MKKEYVRGMVVAEAVVVLVAAGFLWGMGSEAQADNTVTIGGTAPTTDIIESYVPTVATTQLAIRRISSGTGGNATRANAQTFQHSTPFTITAVTFKSSAATTYDTATHVIQMEVVEDTNADGTPDTQVGSDQYFDMAGKSVAVNDFYTFTLGTPTAALQADRTYSVAFWWTTDDSQHNLLMLKASPTATDEYTKGGYISDYNRTWPLINIAPSAPGDYQFYIQGTPPASVEDWKQAPKPSSAK